MNPEQKQNQAGENAEAVQSQGGDGETGTVWHAPNVTIIEMKRTMGVTGAAIDGGFGSSF